MFFLLLSFCVINYFAIKLVFTKGIDKTHKVQQCTIDNLHRNTSFLDNATPISAEEFIHRRDNLAKALHEYGVDAFVLEPGYTFQYYGNISQTDWEPWVDCESSMQLPTSLATGDRGRFLHSVSICFVYTIW